MVKVSVADGKLLVDPAVFGVVEEIAEGANVAVRIPTCLWLCLCLCCGKNFI